MSQQAEPDVQLVIFNAGTHLLISEDKRDKDGDPLLAVVNKPENVKALIAALEATVNGGDDVMAAQGRFSTFSDEA